MFNPRFPAVGAIVFFFAVGTVGFADSPTVSIQQRAELFRGFGGVVLGIDVHVVINCGDGEITTGLGGIVVGARQGDYAAQNANGLPDDTTTRQEVTVFIEGPFEPGEAQASAQLVCGELLAGEELGATIHIVDP